MVDDWLVECPECGCCAEIVWRADVESTSGPVAHAYVRCLERHWFLLPLEYLTCAEQPQSFPGTA